MLKLKMAMYWLCQAPYAWNMKLDAILCQLGFTKCVSEHGLYRRGIAVSRVVVGVYVDDLIITFASKEEVAVFKGEMQRLFRMSDLWPALLLSGHRSEAATKDGDAVLVGVCKEAAGEGRFTGLQPLSNPHGSSPEADKGERGI